MKTSTLWRKFYNGTITLQQLRQLESFVSSRLDWEGPPDLGLQSLEDIRAKLRTAEIEAEDKALAEALGREEAE